jgi:DNA-binding transcriptional LysR family regulator
MARDSMGDLRAFVVVARTRSFTRAAAQLNVSPSALSHALNGLEERLAIRLLNRTTRSVSPTEAGERLLESIGASFDDIDAAVAQLGELRETPAGTVRITAGGHAIESLLWPRLAKVLLDYPDVNVELSTDYGLTDIAAERFDAGVRLGEQVAKDMVAARIGPDLRMAVVGAPDYLNRRGRPKMPPDLTQHACIGLRLPTHGGIYAWEFSRGDKEWRVKVDGQVTFNDTYRLLAAARDGFGLAYVPEDIATPLITEGELERVLADWCEPFAGYHLYYPSRRQPSPAFSVVLAALRYIGKH